MKEMKLGIMQPYFFPYLGYFQLINAVDKFVVYDNIQYTKKGWFNRNRYLCEGRDKYFTVPLAKDSDFLDVCCRKVAKNFNKEKLKNQIRTAYQKAPFFRETFELFCECVDYENDNLFEFIFFSIRRILSHLELDTEIIVSSAVNIEHSALKGEKKVLALCRELNAGYYINSIGGMELYDKKHFKEENIKLHFIKMDHIAYKQWENEFVAGLSILDVLMFNSVEETKEMLNRYILL